MTKKKIILQDKSGNHLYPKTAASQVEVTSKGTMLDQYLKGMVEELSGDTIVVVKEAKKVSNKLQLKDISGNLKEFDGSAWVDLKDGVYYAATAGSATNAEKDSSDRKIIDTYAEKESTENALNAHNQRIIDNKTDITQLKSDLNNLKATATAAYVPKGSVQNVSELAYLTPGTLAKGHVYNIIEAGEFNDADGTTRPFSAGANVVYIGPDGTEKDANGIALTPDPVNTLNWDLLGGIVDMSSYITKDEAEGYATTGDLNTLEGKVNGNTTEITKIKEGTTTVPKATTATNLVSAPVLAKGTTDSNKIKITAGGKTSNELEVPYATKAGSATSATTAEKATKDSNGNTINFSKDGVETLLDLTYSDEGTATY